jgi:hypothetical protein
MGITRYNTNIVKSRYKEIKMSRNKPYYGPAGIFSTGNAQMDQMLIEESQLEEEYTSRDLAGAMCGGCGHDMYECTCPAEYNVAPEKYFCITASCENSDWYDFNLSVPEDNVELTKHIFDQNHAKDCKCGGEPKIEVTET